MTALSHTIMEQYQIRKSKKQKEAFRAWLRETLEKEGYRVSEEKKTFSTNVVVGDPERAKVLLTAHYDTCAVLPIPNFITPRNFLFYLLYQLVLCLPMFGVVFGAEAAILLLWEDCPLWAVMGIMYALLFFMLWWIIDGPANKHTANDNTSGVITLIEALHDETIRSKCAFVLFDHEELGLVGSKQFSKKHKAEIEGKLLLNFDCVGLGDYFMLVQNKKAKPIFQDKLKAAFLPEEGKDVLFECACNTRYPSDQKNFKLGVGVACFKKMRVIGYYMDKIHTKHDTVLQEENVSFLARSLHRLCE